VQRHSHPTQRGGGLLCSRASANDGGERVLHAGDASERLLSAETGIARRRALLRFVSARTGTGCDRIVLLHRAVRRQSGRGGMLCRARNGLKPMTRAAPGDEKPRGTPAISGTMPGAAPPRVSGGSYDGA